MSIRQEQIAEIASAVRATVSQYETRDVSNEVLATIAFEEWCEAFDAFDIPGVLGEFEKAFPRLAWSVV
jgi:hypothetical protein